MKRFAVILIIAVLALGCVFAVSTGDDSTNKVAGSNATSGDKFYVTTQIGRIYPVYQSVGYTGNEETSDDAVSDASGTNSVVGTKSVDNEKEYLTVKVAIQHYGLENNNADSTNKVNIRYKGTVKVTVTAKELKNTDSTVEADALKVNSENHVFKSELPSVSANFVGKTTIANLRVEPNTVSNNVASVNAEYTNGLSVATGTIANGCEFKWETTNLTAGDHYQAEIVVTYESV